MHIIVCGAGQVGSHAAEVLGSGSNNITVIDVDAERLEAIEETMDVAVRLGNCADAEVLRDAGVANADLVLGATDLDEINLLACAIAKGLGAKKTVARVHHKAYFEARTFDYSTHLGIDQLICPEYSTAVAIARTLRNPGALAIEDFGRGAIEMQQFEVGPQATALDRRLIDLPMPERTRVAAITRKNESFVPDAKTTILADDKLVLVGNADVFQEARRLFHDEKWGNKRIVLMGGPAMAVWLCRALRKGGFSIRLFETDRARAEELADKLDWITVLHADPTDPSVFEDENIRGADVFVALNEDDDEHNILSCAWAKSQGVGSVIAVVQRPHYLHLLEHVNIDKSFSPRRVAVREVEQLVDKRPIQHAAYLAEGVIDVFRVRVGSGAPVVGKPLREIPRSSEWIIGAIQHGDDVYVPRADDQIAAGDVLLVIGHHGRESDLKKVFDAG